MYCGAGFKHLTLDDCEHIVSQGPPKAGYQLPDDYYDPEVVAKRKAENQKKYVPTRLQERKLVEERVSG